MYLHIGVDVMVDARKIIGIFGIKAFEKKLLKNIIKANGERKERHVSYVLTDEALFFSDISAVTLKNRFNNIFSSK